MVCKSPRTAAGKHSGCGGLASAQSVPEHPSSCDSSTHVRLSLHAGHKQQPACAGQARSDGILSICAAAIHQSNPARCLRTTEAEVVDWYLPIGLHTSAKESGNPSLESFMHSGWSTHVKPLRLDNKPFENWLLNPSMAKSYIHWIIALSLLLALLI